MLFFELMEAARILLPRRSKMLMAVKAKKARIMAEDVTIRF